MLDSSGDEDFDKSASYRTINASHSERLAERARQRPDKSTLHVGNRDLWAEGEGRGELCIVRAMWGGGEDLVVLYCLSIEVVERA